MVETASTIWADGPASQPQQPNKALIRAWGTWLENLAQAFVSSGGRIYPTRAALNADLARDANSMAWVIEDPIAANNGIYRKVGLSGSGSWVRVADLPYSFIAAENSGTGTANQLQATSSLPVSGSALILLNVYETNTGSPVTVSFNGGDPLTIKSNSGNDVVAGGLPAGMLLLGRVVGQTFRLVSDQASAAILNQMEQLLIDTESAVEQTVQDAVDSFTEQTQDLRNQAQASADDAASSATEAEMYAVMVGAAVYDFNFDTDPSTPGLDWNN